jgi:Protein of unknown function (DUF2793)
MSNPLSFSTATPNLGLPMLIPGQAQKEFFVNQALSILDSMLPQVVEASLAVPPQQSAEGACYRVIAPAAQDWAGCEDHIAIQIGGEWHFIPPRAGMRLFDRDADHGLFYRESWQTAGTVSPPAGGSVIDMEARAAITQLINAFRESGLISA